MRPFAESGGYPVYCLESQASTPDVPSVYLSGGIHGDEPASTEALLSWVGSNPDLVRSLKLLIFPCLNPWGLVHNKRCDEDGIDLNRGYRANIPAVVQAQLAILQGARFDLAINLHEDYDAQGVYLYEPARTKPHWGEKLIEAMSTAIPVDPRRMIDGNKAKAGVIRRRVTLDMMPNWPEAIALHFHHAKRTFTLETASEFAIESRVAAHVAGISAAIRLID
jgi:predicted deacylase